MPSYLSRPGMRRLANTAGRTIPLLEQNDKTLKQISHTKHPILHQISQHQHFHPPLSYTDHRITTLINPKSFCGPIADTCQERLDQHGVALGAGATHKDISQLPVNHVGIELRCANIQLRHLAGIDRHCQ